MSTRSTTHFIDSSWAKSKPVIIYRHSDGYPEGAGRDIERFFEAVESQTNDTRFTDASYIAAKYVVYLAGMFAVITAKYGMEKTDKVEPLNFLSVGIMADDPGDIEYRYTVDVGNLDINGRPTVTVQTIGYETPDSDPIPLATAIAAIA